MSEESRSSEMGKTPSQKERTGWRTIGEIAAVVLIVLVIAGMGSPAVIQSKKKGDRAEAVSNAKQLGLALYNFKADYDSYPSKATAIDVKNNNTETTAALGSTSSNDFFRQLIAAGAIDQERPFFARTLYSQKPDNIETKGKLLEKGEVAFAYVVSHATCTEKGFPIILTPMVKGKLQFDYPSARKYFGCMAVVLSTDNSVVIHAVDEDGHVWINGKDFFDPSQPYWHGIAPKVAWPE